MRNGHGSQTAIIGWSESTSITSTERSDNTPMVTEWYMLAKTTASQIFLAKCAVHYCGCNSTNFLQGEYHRLLTRTSISRSGRLWRNPIMLHWTVKMVRQIGLKHEPGGLTNSWNFRGPMREKFPILIVHPISANVIPAPFYSKLPEEYQIHIEVRNEKYIAQHFSIFL